MVDITKALDMMFAPEKYEENPGKALADLVMPAGLSKAISQDPGSFIDGVVPEGGAPNSVGGAIKAITSLIK